MSTSPLPQQPVPEEPKKKSRGVALYHPWGSPRTAFDRRRFPRLSAKHPPTHASISFRRRYIMENRQGIRGLDGGYLLWVPSV